MVVRSEVGIAAWWIVLLGAAVGALPLARLPRRAWIALGILGAFALWTALGISWSESAERSVAELGRVATLIGLFALTLSVQGPDGLRRMVGGLGAGVTLVAGIALLSRSAVVGPGAGGAAGQYLGVPGPAALSTSTTGTASARFVAIGLPLLVALVTVARSTAGRALAAAAVRPWFSRASSRCPAAARSRPPSRSRSSIALHPARLALALYAALPGGQRDPRRRGKSAQRTGRRAHHGHSRQPKATRCWR